MNEMEKYLIEMVHTTMRNLKDELDLYHGQYKLLTHVTNIEFDLGKYFAYMEMLDDFTTEKAWNEGSRPEWFKLHDQYEALRTEAYNYIESCYGKLKEV